MKRKEIEKQMEELIDIDDGNLDWLILTNLAPAHFIRSTMAG